MPKPTDEHSAPSHAGTLRTLSRDEHGISRKDISDAAIRVMQQLIKAGFQAHLVGGGVRDLLLGGHPKDFDVATDASPEQVKNLFRSARIVGRRFRIVHVRYGREVIEVTTFRGHHDQDELEKHQSHRNAAGMLLRDNVYGNMEEDALRRDLTVNAIYYSLDGFAVHDYVGGIEDLRAGLIRMIGDPETRYREDPVRMLRVARFAAKLDFDIEASTAAPLTELAHMIGHVPAARLFDEVLKLFQGGKAVKTFALLRQFGLFEPLFPATEQVLANGVFRERSAKLIDSALANTDRRLQQGKSVTPAFIYAAFCWPVVEEAMHLRTEAGDKPMDAFHTAATQCLNQQLQHTAIPRRFSQPMREIWELQLRLPRHSGKRAQRLRAHPRFRAAYDFLLLREASGVDLDGLGQWWTDYQKEHPAPPPESDAAERPQTRRRPRRRNRSGNR